MTKWLLIVCCWAVPLVMSAQTPKPSRTVHANTVSSVSDPQIQITLPKEAQYVGADRWVLYGVADCEVHVFVEADEQKKLRRLYWIQFEGFVPSKPELKYDYSSNPVQDIGGLKFHVRPRFGATDDPVKPGSDSERVRQLIKARGYIMPAGMMNVRLVHLPDEQRRKELMIIYAEDTASAGVEWKDLLPGGKAADRWEALQRTLIESVSKRIVFSR
jgi:hypothetical protein